jgi:phage gp36-like protein
MYATLKDLVNAATGGWGELAQRASASALVDGDLLQATAAGTDRSAWSVQAQLAADSALVRCQDALTMASKHADSYLFPRWRTAMPLAPELVAGSDLGSAVAAIALRRLYGAAVPEDVRRGTAWADTYLSDLAHGRVSLGAADAQVARSAGHMSSRTSPKAFDWEAYP